MPLPPMRRVRESEEFMQKSRKVHPFEQRLRLLEEALEQIKQKMDETDGEGREERVSDRVVAATARRLRPSPPFKPGLCSQPPTESATRDYTSSPFIQA